MFPLNKVIICTQNERNNFSPSDFEVIPLKYVSDPMERRALREVIPSRQIIGTLLTCRFLSSFFI